VQSNIHLLYKIGAALFFVGLGLMVIGHKRSNGLRNDMCSKIGYWIFAPGCACLALYFIFS